MRKSFICFLFIVCYLSAMSQKDSTYLKKNRLPYNKSKGLQLAYCTFSPSIRFTLPKFDYGFSVTSSPTFAYYLNKKLETIFSYGFTFIKYGSLSSVRAEGFNQFSAAVHYYPFKNINFLYAEGGFVYGNYGSKKNTRELVKEWYLSTIAGVGIEVITKKRIVVTFNAAYVIPFDSNSEYDFVRSIGIGFQLDKKKK